MSLVSTATMEGKPPQGGFFPGTTPHAMGNRARSEAARLPTTSAPAPPTGEPGRAQRAGDGSGPETTNDETGPGNLAQGRSKPPPASGLLKSGRQRSPPQIAAGGRKAASAIPANALHPILSDSPPDARPQWLAADFQRPEHVTIRNADMPPPDTSVRRTNLVAVLFKLSDRR